MTSTEGAGLDLPAPGSTDERAQFVALQTRLPGLFARLLPAPKAPRCVVVNPGLSHDPEVLTGIPALDHLSSKSGSRRLFRDAGAPGDPLLYQL